MFGRYRYSHEKLANALKEFLGKKAFGKDVGDVEMSMDLDDLYVSFLYMLAKPMHTNRNMLGVRCKEREDSQGKGAIVVFEDG